MEFDIPDVSIGNTISLTQTHVILEKKEPVFELQTLLSVTPATNVNPILISCDGQFDFTNKQVTLDGALASDWAFPGADKDSRLVVKSAEAKMVVSIASKADLGDKSRLEITSLKISSHQFFFFFFSSHASSNNAFLTSFNFTRIVSGQVSATFAYGEVGLGMALDYPAADNTKATALELTLVSKTCT
jgi:hypothetical protein